MSKKESKIIVILDESGSMQQGLDQTIASFNEFVVNQREESPTTEMTLVLFNLHNRVVYKDMPLRDVPLLTRQSYRPDGITALLDAIVDTVKPEIKLKRDGKTVLCILTDGEENASKLENTKLKVAKLLRKCQDKLNWDVLYFGANIDSFAEAGSIGIRANTTMNYSQTDSGIRSVYTAMTMAVSKSLAGEDVDLANIASSSVN